MASNWQQFLTDQGFIQHHDQYWLEGVSTSKSDQTPIAPPSLIDLSHWAVVKVNGSDANNFLQGQFSNDLNALCTAQPHQLAAYCNPKGRMLALFHLIKAEGAYWLCAPHAVITKALPRLKMFVMRADVQFEELPDHHIIAVDNLITPLAAPLLHSAAISDLPNWAFILGHSDPLQAFWQTEISARQIGDSRDWLALEIKYGLPQVYTETVEALIPQQVNLDLVNGVNFKKGCYPGQEIIARIRYRGKPKTRMIGVQFKSGVSIQVGQPVFIPGREQAAGIVVNHTQSREGETLASLTVPLSHLSEGELRVDTIESAPQRLEHPYAIPEAAAPN